MPETSSDHGTRRPSDKENAPDETTEGGIASRAHATGPNGTMVGPKGAIAGPNGAVAGPVLPTQRIMALDVLRGFALLGILLMNIQSFSMIEAAYLNPAAYGDLAWLNRWVWILSHVLADQKFMTLFSVLFGAGILLMTGRIEARGLSPAVLHYRRTVGLIAMGLLHAYLLWYGDVLVTYGLCALVVYLFRKVSPKWQLTIGLLALAIPSLIYILFGLSLPFWPRHSYQEVLLDWAPSAERIREQIAAYQGSWLDQMACRIPSAAAMHTFLFLIWGAWRAGGLMLVGMALFQWGVITAKRSRTFYTALTGIGLGIGLPVVILGVIRNFEANWSLDYSMFLGSQYNYWGSLLVALGYGGGVMLLCTSARLQALMCPLAPIGRMALTNYLLQTLIATTIFYGHGLGWFGEIERSGQLLIVLLIWLVQGIASALWLRHFRFGPLEWAWRSFTYWRLQPLRTARRPECAIAEETR
jgi:uncharacterized protein